MKDAAIVTFPLPLIIQCPSCHLQHVDRGEWATKRKLHKTHLCEYCGHLWRPALVPTAGVAELPIEPPDGSD